MNYKIFLCFMLLSYSVSAFPKSDEEIDNFQDKDDDDDENDYKSSLADEEFKTTSITVKPRSQYEVTEIVIDIPDNRTKGPIVTNYTIYRPLNTVLNPDKEIIENINKTNGREENKITTVTLNKNSEGKKNSFSVFHVKVEVEDKTEKVTPVVNFYHVPHLFGIKDYLHGIKQGIVNGFNSIIHKHKREDGGYETPGPLGLLSKLHKKSSDAAHKIHDVVFGHTIDEQI